ncbi:MAG: lamin tail domain-containing protein [Nitriliruptoraceae bacterium]|nr:lamin tail domain-containing protein [Nitriliruptoraceae bacterium]
MSHAPPLDHRSVRRSLLALLSAVALALSLTPILPATADDARDSGAELVISQVYGGGGNTGATWSNSFVELLNRTGEEVALDGLSLQYGAAAGNFGNSSGLSTNLSGTVAPGGYVLVQLAGGLNDPQALPEPDVIGTTNPAGTNGKFALVDGTELLGCGASSNACTDSDFDRIIDLVAYGSATPFEGSGAAQVLNNNASALRLAEGCQDTDDNAADFERISPPQPRNSASDPVDCAIEFDGPDTELVVTNVLTNPSFEQPGDSLQVPTSWTVNDFGNQPFDGARIRTKTVEDEFPPPSPLPDGDFAAEIFFQVGTDLGEIAYGFEQTADTFGDIDQDAVESFEYSVAQTFFPNSNSHAWSGSVAEVEIDTADGAHRLRYFHVSTSSDDTRPEDTDEVTYLESDPLVAGEWLTVEQDLAGDLAEIADEYTITAVRFINTMDRTAASPFPNFYTFWDAVSLEAEVEREIGTGPDLVCDTPFAITEGYGEQDGPNVAGKAINVSASDVEGDVEFAVRGVSPEPSDGGFVLEAGGASAEVRASADLPGLDPRAGSANYQVTIDATDDAGTSSCTVGVTVLEILSIGDLRGAVPDDANGRSYTPAAVGNTVATTGVVTQLTLEESGSGVVNGFFLQSLDEDADLGDLGLDTLPRADALLADGDERSSDGIWVRIGNFDTLRSDTDSSAPFVAPEVGDVVVLRGPVASSFQQTQINNPFVVDVVAADTAGVDLDTDIRVAEVDPPDDVQEASVYWERLAGMQVEVPADSLVVSGNEFFAPSTSEFWVIRGDHPVAQREDPDARRVFRPYHPLAHPMEDAEGNATEFEDRIDQNGFRILLGSFGVKATEGDATALITPARAGDTLVDNARGGLYFGFEKYQVMVDTAPELERGPDPSESSLGVVDGFDPAEEYSVMVYNVENLYDFRDDPLSACDVNPGDSDDFGPNPGCTPDEGSQSPPSNQPTFGYAPRSQQAYDEQRIAIAEQIVVALESPDIITVQEAEKQDVCVPIFDEAEPAASTMECDLSPALDGETMANTERGSGAPDTVEELAIEIFRLTDGEVRYEASGDAVNGRDVRGITQGFLHRVDRVELVPVEELADDPVLGAGDAINIPYPSVEERTPVAPWVTDQAANPKSINAELPDDVSVADGGRFPQTGYVFTRGVQVGKFRIYPDGVDSGGPFVDRYITSNHMSAGPDGRVEQRTEQARLNAAVNQAVVDNGGRVMNTGDFNVFPRPDDPFPAFKTDPDREPSDQLGPLYERGFLNLHDVIIEQAPANTYSFIFRGISQILDHIFVDQDTLDELVIARYIHVNIDYPAETPGFEPARGASDHDPLYARFSFGLEDDEEPPTPPSTPTDKDQCRNGGWQDFDDPSFRNQGQCVSFVASGQLRGPSGNAGPPSTVGPPGRGVGRR